jgi:hypothetical protein
MLLINGKQLLVSEALQNDNHPLHAQAVDYNKGVKELREKFGKVIRFENPVFPRFNQGTDSKGEDTTLAEPSYPTAYPLRTAFTHPTRGMEVWSCCVTLPKLQPNGLWEMGDKRSIRFADSLNVDLNKDPDLAYYLYFISNSMKSGRIKVSDPKGDVRKKANKKREEVEVNTAIWQMLEDESLLRRMAMAYGISDTAKKEPDAIRFELEALLIANNDKKRKDPSVKGTAEFLEEMKVTDAVRLRAFIKILFDDKIITDRGDGRLRIGEKVLAQVPYESIKDPFNFLCNFYHAPNNSDKLQDVMRDVMSKEKLDKFEEKDYAWICKVMGVQTVFKKKEEIKTLAYEAFSLL